MGTWLAEKPIGTLQPAVRFQPRMNAGSDNFQLPLEFPEKALRQNNPASSDACGIVLPDRFVCMKQFSKRTIELAAGVLALMMAILPASADIVVSTSVRFDMAADDQTPETRGNEVTVPFGIAYNGRNLSVGLESAYSNAYVETGDDADSGLDGLTDTLLSLLKNR